MCVVYSSVQSTVVGDGGGSVTVYIRVIQTPALPNYNVCIDAVFGVSVYALFLKTRNEFILTKNITCIMRKISLRPCSCTKNVVSVCG